MDLRHRENNGSSIGAGAGRTPVPKFGGWDHSSGSPDYSMVFTRARANRKQNKYEFNRSSLGNERELINHYPPSAGHVQPARKQKRLARYLSCCMF